MSWRHNLAARLLDLAPDDMARLTSAPAVSADLTSDEGWQERGRRLHDRSAAEMRSQYEDALTAWRKNPLAWRMIQITTDYTVGQGITLSSGSADMQRFIDAFWHHPQNRLGLRLASMAEELARCGDLFPVLFRQKHTGVSLLRFLTKDQVLAVETKGNDWETETAVLQAGDDPLNPKRWLMPAAAGAKRGRAVCLHYHVNRPLGAMFGESDLATTLPWLQRYSRLLEDRVRFHWAARMFLWLVQVPANRVLEKAEQYRLPPEAGSIIVHDEAESWTAVSPVLRGADAAPDLKAVRQMIDAGSGYPPHWRGEATDVNLATAQAMQEPAERHLARRQDYFVWMLQDMTYHAYSARTRRGRSCGRRRGRELRRPLSGGHARRRRARQSPPGPGGAGAFRRRRTLKAQYPGSPTLRRLLLKLVLQFAGEPQEDQTLDAIMREARTQRRTADDAHTTAKALEARFAGRSHATPDPERALPLRDECS